MQLLIYQGAPTWSEYKVPSLTFYHSCPALLYSSGNSQYNFLHLTKIYMSLNSHFNTKLNSFKLMFRCQVVNCEISILYCFPDSRICYIGFWGLGAHFLWCCLYTYIRSALLLSLQSNKNLTFRDAHVWLLEWNGRLWSTVYVFRFCKLLFLRFESIVLLWRWGLLFSFTVDFIFL